MNESFKALREAATAKRDSAIRAAKNEYNETIQKISELETRLRGERRPRPKAASTKTKLADLIYSVLPDDRSFSLDDVIGLVRSADSDRKFARNTIYTNLNRFLHSGAIKRVRFAGHKTAALFALPDVDVGEAKTMLDWAKEVDGYQELEPVEIMVRIVENGYEMEVPPNEAVRSLERELQKPC